MAETVQGIPESEGKASSSKAWIIVVVVIVVLCCMMAMCAGIGWWLWENGDRFLDDFIDWSTLLFFVS